jgi:hypothetical protein
MTTGHRALQLDSPFQHNVRIRYQVDGMSSTSRNMHRSLGKEENVMLTKKQLIDGITEINPSADLSWLDDFADDELQRYLDHLQLTIEPRGTSWMRTHETTAVVCRNAA